MAKRKKKKKTKSKAKSKLAKVPSRKPTGQSPSLADPVLWLKSCSASIAAKLERLKIESVYDLLTHYPRAYSVRRRIAKLKHGEMQAVSGCVVEVENRVTRGRRMRVCEVTIEEDGAQVVLVFFNQPWIARKLQVGQWLEAVGMVDFAYGGFTLRPTTWNVVKEADRSRLEDEALLPEYPLTEGLTNEVMTTLQRDALSTYGRLVAKVIDDELAHQLKLMPEHEALEQIHFPPSQAFLAAAKLTLKFREFYLLQLGLALRQRTSRMNDGQLVFEIDGELRARCKARFPFAFTGAQERVVDEVCVDLSSPGRMNRLVQGDVGSGKTAVAVYSMLLAVGNGYQAALIAPTEILARQHMKNVSNYLKGSKVQITLLTGSTPKAERPEILEAIESGQTHIVIGTHALIQPSVVFENLGLIVIDEQHKFGVKQRQQLAEKGNQPHRLAMSATPIPRTLSLTLYGDLDVSIVDEMPPGRKPVVTSWVPSAAREKTFEQIHRRLEAGDQAYVIYPLVKPNPTLELQSASELYDSLKKEFSDVGIALVHGQLSTEEKEAAMQRFARGQAKLLIATVVVEVGVDVPAANIMVIEHAERFGLSQLHQLRGRIGRGGEQGYLYLFAEPSTDSGRQRLETLCRTSDGFEIAEADMRLRGYGDFIGTRQAGMPKLSIADPVADMKILARARSEAFKRLEDFDADRLREVLALEFGQALSLVSS